MEAAEYCVLVAEEDAIIRLSWTQELNRSGYATLDAANFAEAWSVASGHRGSIYALVTDQHPPELDGRKLGCDLRQWRPCMKVIVVSTYSAAEFLPPLLHDAVLEMPVSPRDVAATVTALLLADRVFVSSN